MEHLFNPIRARHDAFRHLLPSAPTVSYRQTSWLRWHHILRAAEFLRDLVAREVVLLKHVPGSTMVADLLTKAVSRVVFIALLKLLDEYAATGTVCPA